MRLLMGQCSCHPTAIVYILYVVSLFPQGTSPSITYTNLTTSIQSTHGSNILAQLPLNQLHVRETRSSRSFVIPTYTR